MYIDMYVLILEFLFIVILEIYGVLPNFNCRISRNKSGSKPLNIETAIIL